MQIGTMTMVNSRIQAQKLKIHVYILYVYHMVKSIWVDIVINHGLKVYISKIPMLKSSPTQDDNIKKWRFGRWLGHGAVPLRKGFSIF